MDRYGPPREAWPKLKFDFPEAKLWPAKLNVAEFLVDRNVEKGLGGKTAVLHEDRRITYGELQKLVNSFGHALKSLGVGIGDRVMLRLPNIPEFLISHLAVQKIGAVSVPVHPLLRAKEISYIAADCEAKVLITTAQMVEEVEKAREELKTVNQIVVASGEAGFPHLNFEDLMEKFKDSAKLEAVRVDPDEIALLQYTSGTTGPPKGCIHTHRDYLAVGECYARKVMLSNESDVWGGPASIVFSLGHNALISDPFYCGAASSLAGDKRFDPSYMLELIEKHRITVFCAVPTAYRAIVAEKKEREKYDLSSLRVCVTGGEHCPPSLYHEIKEFFGCEVLNHIGCTEMHHAFISARFGQVKPGSLGIPVPGYDVRVVDEDGRELPPNEAGHLAVVGPTGTRYWRKPEKQIESVKGGWNYTGDVVYRDGDGFLWYVGRSDDIIKTAAYRVSPHEVEETLTKHPAVAEAAVVGLPDPERGQVVAAFVVLKPNFKPGDELEEAIRNFVKTSLAPYKAPRLIKFVAELPKTETGKIKRSALRK
ncbi:MAG: acyl-CoA synthetase [Nitrososphaerota archaeon]|nr:acyl-CoA synthetase [Candidatus Bathyarchaeota archaeon]MDW8022671.1 acyl-CoA synthetase [Nitrososphaerota archaeon]